MMRLFRRLCLVVASPSSRLRNAVRPLRYQTLDSRQLLAADLGGESEPIHVAFAPGTLSSYVESVHDQIGHAGGDLDDVDASRWSSTAIDGGGLTRGDATTLTWSIVPDGTTLGSGTGEPNTPSDFRSFLNDLYGSVDQWLPLIQASFDAWEAVSGIDFVYEPADDGARYRGSNQGIEGVRGDIRLGGHAIDGNSNTLAYNYYPNHGDMVIDTDDSFYSNLGNDSLRLRNVLMHEIGHGLGLPHSEPTNQTKLMEPFISLSFDGPQEDDILRINRGYGDRFEGNDSQASATDLGTLTSSDLGVTQLSIDGDGDIDFFRFQVDQTSDLNVAVTPTGTIYSVASEGGSVTEIDAAALNDLAIRLLTADGTTIGAANTGDIGDAETLSLEGLAAGEYLVEIIGAIDQVQMYSLELQASVGTVSNRPPVIADVPDQTATAGTPKQITLDATDPDGDLLTFTATAGSLEYALDQALQLNGVGGAEYLNWGGLNEKWLSSGGDWYYITPDGGLYQWDGGSLSDDPLIQQLGTAVYADTSLLHSASSPAGVSATVVGGTLTVTTPPTFEGTLLVNVTVADASGLSDQTTFQLTVSAGAVVESGPPVLAAISDVSLSPGRPSRLSCPPRIPTGIH